MQFSAFISFLALAATGFGAITHKGHDLSSLTMMETAEHAQWHTASGASASLTSILGGNAARLRTWVSDKGNYNTAYTLALAKQLSAANYKILLDMHLSDTWADPTHQSLPAGWPSDVNGVSTKLRQYVSNTLQQYLKAGVKVDLVQLGNEIPEGMLFPAGKISNNNFQPFATLLKAAIAGVHDAATAAGKTAPGVVLHLNNGWDSGLQTWWYKSLFATGLVKASDIAVMGVSFYPFFGTSATLANLKTSLNALANTYKKPVMVVETNWPATSCGSTKLSEAYPATPAGQVQWIKGIEGVLDQVPNGLGQGLFYFEPAFINNTSLGSPCADNSLFTVDWKTWPNTKVTARSSAGMLA
ncbi:hypothetical protein B9Z65_4981 [Elsinoe australis]|uniref:Arabinogalactan endo-beta-1,4-galactanase n=1 Tax=Elsinoe australis TaxID=40998 RepID=A0A2P7ZCS0_9PEZI|nr:hypothetical protein B9Z65_4981 [Elsinoe australis]